MSTIGWILLIALFVGVHLLMHRGHGSHSARGAGRARRESHQHAAGGDGDTTATSEPPRHSHRGC